MRVNLIRSGWAGLLATAGGLLLAADEPFWWAGVASLVTAFYLLWVTFGANLRCALGEFFPVLPVFGLRINLRNPLAELLGIAIVGIVAGYMIHPSLLGDRPIGWDHTVHYFKAWQLSEYFIPSGRLFGWSHSMFAGYPVSYLYPFLADLFPTIVQFLSFGLLSFSQAFSLSFSLSFFVMGYGVYYFGRRCFNRPVGIIAAIFYLSDGGGPHIGGWQWAVHGGIWISSLSTSVLFIALAHLRSLLDGRKSIDLVVFSLASGFALLLHPLALVGAFTLVPLGVFSCMICLEDCSLKHALKRLGSGLFLAALIAALWYLPFLSLKDYALDLGHSTGSIQEIAWEFSDLTFFGHLSPFVTVLGLAGALFMILKRKIHHFYTGLCVFALLIFGSDTFLEAFKLDSLFEGLGYIDYRRVPVLFKPFYFLSAAYLLYFVFTYSDKQQDPESVSGPSMISWQAGCRVFATVFVLAPFVVPFSTRLADVNLKRVYQLESSRFLKKEMDDLITWANDGIAKEKEYFRLGINMRDTRNMLHDLPESLHLPQYKFNGTPAANFIHKPTSSDPELLKALSVKYVISDTPLPAGSYDPVIRFGRLMVYRFREWSPKRYAVIDGAGEISVVRFEDEEIIIDAKPDASGKLRVHVSYFPRWKATHNGSPIKIDQVGIRDIEGVSLMSVDLRPGTYRFVFRKSWIEYLAVLLFLGGIGLIGFKGYSAIREELARPG